MATKRFNELKSMSKDELASKLREFEGQLFEAKIKRATGQLADTAMIWRLRKDIARVKMLSGQPGRGKATVAKAMAEGKGK